jgi:RHS repeat-associated protein
MIEPSGTTSYTYDDLYRLTEVSYPSGSPANVSYTYDPMGNRLSMTQDGVTTNYNYDAADRLTSTTGGLAMTFTWDDNGQMLSKGSQTFNWDAFGRMTNLTNDGTNASYIYNGDGVRVSHTVNGSATSYLQDLAAGLPMVVAQTTGSDTLRYVNGLDLIAQVDGTNPSYYHADGLGSTRVMTDTSGVQSAAYTYDAFGSVRTQIGGNGNQFTYAGEQVDPEAGLVFLRARYYDPAEARFLSKDPFVGQINNPQSLNRYPYTQNNPVRYTDPKGEFIIVAIAAVVVAYAGYETYSAWTDYLHNANQLESELKLHYSGDFENPAWQQNEQRLVGDIRTTLRSGAYAAVKTPGTSVTGPPPTGLGWNEIVGFVLDKFIGFEKPSPNRVDTSVGSQEQVLGLSSEMNSTYSPYYQGSWNSPASSGK